MSRLRTSKRLLWVTTIVASLSLTNVIAQPTTNAIPTLDPVSANKITTALAARQSQTLLSDQIEAISRTFLGTPYQANMMIGSAATPERLVTDVTGLDCFTYLDTVVASLHARTTSDFPAWLIKTRYIDSQVDFYHRKHFFTDWAYRDTVLANDITATLSPATQTAIKQLNQKADGSRYLPGLPVVQRAITYLPATTVDQTLLNQLQTGDLIGIYTDLAGLDVSHVGFFIRTNKGAVFRHASSQPSHPSVIDQPFLDYIRRKPGIVVLRLRS